MFGKEVVKSGYLTKSPPDNKSTFYVWKKRYFILIDSLLVYPFAPRNIRIEYYPSFEESKSGNPLGLIELNSCSGVLNREQMKSHKHVFDIVTPTRVFHLSADSSEERDQWVHVLNMNIFALTQKSINRFDPSRRSSDFTPETDTAAALFNSISRDGNISRAKSLRSTKSASTDPVSLPDMFILNRSSLANPAKLPSNLRLISSPEECNDPVFKDSACDNEIFSEKGFTSVPLNARDMQMSLPVDNESPYINVTFTTLPKSANVSPTHPMKPSPYKKIPQSASITNFPHQKLSGNADPVRVEVSSRGPVLEEYAKVHRNK